MYYFNLALSCLFVAIQLHQILYLLFTFHALILSMHPSLLSFLICSLANTIHLCFFLILLICLKPSCCSNCRNCCLSAKFLMLTFRANCCLGVEIDIYQIDDLHVSKIRLDSQNYFIFIFISISILILHEVFSPAN